MSPSGWVRDARIGLARLSSLRVGRVPDAPALPVRDPWPGDPGRGARLMKGEVELSGTRAVLQPGGWPSLSGSTALRARAHGFTWLRDLRSLGTDGARMRARALVADWIARSSDPLARRPDVVGARLAAWLGHYDFFAASADDEFRQRLMARLVSDARTLAAHLPMQEMDGRALTALKGLVAAAVAMPEHAPYLTRALRLLPQEIGRQVLSDGCHAERSPAAQLAALQDLTEMRALLQAAQASAPSALGAAIERMAPALRALRHGDGGLVLFNGAREEPTTLIDVVLTQAGRGGRAPAGLGEGGFHRLQAGRCLVVVDAGAPPPSGIDRLAHAGTLSMEMSVGRDRLVVNCGASPAASGDWHDASRATAAHSTLAIADTNSSELKPSGLGRRAEVVEVRRQEANGAQWLEASHDGYQRQFGAIHRRRLYLADSGDDLRGEDSVESEEPRAFALRFHLHPAVGATRQPEGDSVQMRLPGGTWRLRADGAKLELEDSVYLGGPEPRPCRQVVLSGSADGPQTVKWAITRTG